MAEKCQGDTLDGAGILACKRVNDMKLGMPFMPLFMAMPGIFLMLLFLHQRCLDCRGTGHAARCLRHRQQIAGIAQQCDSLADKLLFLRRRWCMFETGDVHGRGDHLEIQAIAFEHEIEQHFAVYVGTWVTQQGLVVRMMALLCRDDLAGSDE